MSMTHGMVIHFFSKDEYKLTDEMVDKFKEKEKISIANYTRLLARKI